MAYGADVRATGKHGTPLHEAARKRNVRIVNLLLDHGADLNTKDTDGKTPIEIWSELADIVKEREAEFRAEMLHRRRGGFLTAEEMAAMTAWDEAGGKPSKKVVRVVVPYRLPRRLRSLLDLVAG